MRHLRTLPRELLRHCRVLSSRADIVALIPKGTTFCEIGVALGEFSEQILGACAVSKFYAIDLFTLHDDPQMWDGKVGRELNGMKHADYYRKRFRREIGAGLLEMMVGDSVSMLERLPSNGVDVFYIDANHSYRSVKKELSVIRSKARANGWVILNDYTMIDWLTDTPYGVVQATNEFMIDEGWEMLYFALHRGMFCDVVIKKLR